VRKVGERKSNHARIFQNFSNLDLTLDHAEKLSKSGAQNLETKWSSLLMIKSKN